MTTPLPPDDPELADIFAAEPELRELWQRLRAARPNPVVGPHFQAYLRARIMDAARRELRPRRRLRLRLAPILAWSGAGLGAAMIAAVATLLVTSHPSNQVADVAYTSQVEGRADVDPNDVIRISFDRSMDHLAVVRGLRIEPATAYTTRWDGNTLVITPAHHLAANVPYVVVVPRQAARTADGHVAAKDVHITFGTQPTPTPSPSSPPLPTLVPRPLGPVSPNTGLIVASDGGVIATEGTPPPATPAPSPTATTVSPSTSTTGSASSAAPLPSPTAPAPALVRFAADGRVLDLGEGATAAALSGDGRYLASIVPDGGAADVRVVGVDGTQVATLTRSADLGSPVAWSQSGNQPAVVFVGGGQFRSVDLGGRVRRLGALQVVAPGEAVVLAPDGRHAYLGPSPLAPVTPEPAPPTTTPTTRTTTTTTATPTVTRTPGAPPASTATLAAGPYDGRLVDLRTGEETPLPGSAAGVVAFSGDGSTVVWVDGGPQSPPELRSTSTSGTSVARVTIDHAGLDDTVSGLAVDGDGGRAAYVLHHQGGATLEVVDLHTGMVLGVLAVSETARPALSPSGESVAAVVVSTSGPEAVVAPLAASPQTPGPSPTPAPLAPAAASAVAGAVAAAQVGLPGAPPLSRLTVPSLLDVLTQRTPAHLTRAYVIRVTPARTSASGSTVEAEIRLVRDPTPTSPTLVADEKLTLVQPAPDQSYRVVAADIGPLAPEPSGPQVVHLEAATTGSATVLRVTFDSDLDPLSVPAAVRVVDAAGSHLEALVTYDAENRTAVVTVTSGQPARLAIDTTLHDVDGQPLAVPFTAGVAG